MVIIHYLYGDVAYHHSTYADLSFIVWEEVCHRDEMYGSKFEDEMVKDYHNYKSWYKRLTERPAVQRVFKQMYEKRAEYMAQMVASTKG
jgi:glutathione S-transferase